MDAYEIRLNLLSMAQNALESTRNQNHAIKEEMWRENYRKGPAPHAEPITAKEIIDYASELNNFISFGKKSKDETKDKLAVITMMLSELGHKFNQRGTLVDDDGKIITFPSMEWDGTKIGFNANKGFAPVSFLT